VWVPYFVRMADPIIVMGLRRKRDQISGIIAGYDLSSGGDQGMLKSSPVSCYAKQNPCVDRRKSE